MQTISHKPVQLANLGTVSIIIPAYNEEKRIIPVLEEIENLILSEHLNWEVIVSIDGNDKTIEIVKLHEQRAQIIKANYSIQRGGMGGAIKRGILSSSGETIILMDADGSTSLIDLLRAISNVNTVENEFINFNRYYFKENLIPFKRRLVSRGFNIILRVVFGIEVKDTQCGYKIIKRAVLDSFLKNITVTNAFFLTALFIYSKDFGIKTIEVPINYKHTSGSKFNVIMTAVSYVVSISAFKIKKSKVFNHIPHSIKKFYYNKLRYL